MAIILDGKTIASKILENIKNEVNLLSTKPKLAVVLVGNNPASKTYVNSKKIAAEKIGINSLIVELPELISQDNLSEQIDILNEDPSINGILVQLPLPKHIDSNKILTHIDPIKDVDGLNTDNMGKILSGQKPFAYPCTPKGIMTILNEYKINLEGLNAVVVGRSNLVGKPIAQMLLSKNATVTTAHSKTKQLIDYTKNADLIIMAVGSPKLLTAEMVKDGVIIIDVGFNKTNGVSCGDCDFENVKNKASYITPVPGGVGPMTIATLMENTIELYKLQKNYTC